MEIDKILKVIGIILMAIGIIILVIGIDGIIFWGLGLFVIRVFHIYFTWTFWHGISCGILWILLKELFSRGK